MAYSEDFRRLAVDLSYKQGVYETSELMGVGERTLVTWRSEFQQGKFCASYPTQKPHLISRDTLESELAKQPDIYVYELAEKIGQKTGTVQLALTRHQLTRKKRQPNTKNDAKSSVQSI